MSLVKPPRNLSKRPLQKMKMARVSISMSQQLQLTIKKIKARQLKTSLIILIRRDQCPRINNEARVVDKVVDLGSLDQAHQVLLAQSPMHRSPQHRWADLNKIAAAVQLRRLLQFQSK